MNIQELQIEGVFLINNFSQKDIRGIFVKPFSNILPLFNEIHFEINEVSYSISKKNVIRGMHFQRPPMDYAKLIYLTSGSITDVLLDLRKTFNTYKSHISIDLSAHENALFIPPGIANGYLSKEDETTVVYNLSIVYSQNHDDGIRWNSFGYDWEVDVPILSDRDQSFIKFNDFSSPFN